LRGDCLGHGASRRNDARHEAGPWDEASAAKHRAECSE
jgi:hypothetical protein